MLSFLRRRAAKAGKPSRQHYATCMEPLETRRLLSTDVTVQLHLSSSSTLIAGLQPHDLVYDSTRDQLIVLTEGTVRRYDGASGQLMATRYMGGPMENADITADGSYLYIARNTGQLVWRMDLASNQMFGVVVSDPSVMAPGDVAVGTADVGAIVSNIPEPGHVNTIRRITLPTGPVWDLSDGGGALTFSEFAVLARSADHTYIVMVSPNSDFSYSGGVISGVSGRSFGSISGVAVSRDGALHAIATESTLLVEDASFGLVHEIAVGGAGVAFSPAADVMYVADPATDMLRAFNTSTWEEIVTTAIGEDLATSTTNGSGVMTLNDDGSMLYLATPSGVRIFDLTGSNSFYGGTVTLTADMDALDASGLVTFVDAGTGTTLGQAPLTGGSATFSINTLHAGGYSVLAHYEGDANYNPADSAQNVLTVKRAITTWTWGLAIPGSVTLSINSDAVIPDGDLTLFEGGTLIASGSLSGGAVDFAVNLSIATHTLHAVYPGSSDFLPITTDDTAIAVKQPTATTLQVSSTNILYGQLLTLTATVSPTSSSQGRTVTFLNGASILGSAVANSAGAANLFLPLLEPGLYQVTAQFVETDSAHPSTSSATDVNVAALGTTSVLAGPATTPLAGALVTLTAYISSETGRTVTEGQVQFMRGTQLLGSAAAAGGVAALSGVDLGGGTSVITAIYVGTSRFQQSTSNQLTYNIVKAATSLGLIRSATWIPKGQYVQWRATVSAAGVPASQITGNVTFKEGTRILATVALSNGVATFQSKALAIGDHLISASFAGTSSFKASSSKALKTTVVAATRIDLMIVYTPKSVSELGGQEELTSEIKDSVWGTNTALWNSRVPVWVRLVYSGLVNYVESGKMSTDLTRLAGTQDGFMDNVHSLRNLYKADLVSLFETENDEGGLGYELMDVKSAGNAKYGFNVVRAAQAAGPSYTLAHELGHNLGASHDRENAEGPGATSYAYGWRFWAGGVQYHDIMAYSPGQTIPYFSNPRVNYKGVPTGTATADNARTITFTAPYVAKYRS
jgi:hypothetical protein